MAARESVGALRLENWLIVVAVLKLAFGAAMFWLGAVIVRENRTSRINRITAMMLLFAGLGPIFSAVGTLVWPELEASVFTLQEFPFSLVYIWELFFPQLLLFALTFPVEQGWATRHPRARMMIFVPHVFHIVLMVFWSTPDFSWLVLHSDSALLQTLLVPANLLLRLMSHGLSLLFQSHLKLFSLVNLAYIALAVMALRHGYHTLTNPRLKDQVVVLIGGILTAVGLYAVAFIGPALGLYELPYFAHISLYLTALFVGSASVVWSIIRHQFLDIRLLVRQSLVFTVSSALLVGLYLLLITKVSVIIKELLEIETLLVDVAFVFLLLIFFQPVKDRIDETITRLFMRSESDPRAIIESFSRTLATVFTMDELKTRMLDIVTRQLFVERAFVAVQDTSTGRFRLELAGLQRESFPADDPFFVEAGEYNRPVAFDEFVLDRPLTVMTEILSRWNCRLVVPVVDRGELRMVLLLGEKATGGRYLVEDIHLLSTLANQMAMAQANVSLYQQALERQRLEDEMNVARKIQLQLLPQSSPQGETFSVAAFSQPSRQVGGDYYDFIMLPDERLGLVIADVSGKGIGAALLVSQLQAIIRAELRNRRCVNEYIASANEQVYQVTASDQFATLVYAEYDMRTGRLEYSNAGHNYPFVVHADGSHSLLDRGGMILGAFDHADYEIGSVMLVPGDTLLFFTDGLSDLRDRHGHDFGEDQILQLLRANRHRSVEEIKDEIVLAANEFSRGELGFDDLTLIVMKITAPPRPSTDTASIDT